MENVEYKGKNGFFVLTETGVLIKRGFRGFLFGGGMIRGEKIIPYNSIVAIQFKKAGLTSGYLQLSLRGGSEAKAGLFEALKDENTISFDNWGKNNDKFEELKVRIEEKMNSGSEKKPNSNLSELEKLAELKEKGIVTQEEFDAKKKILLGL